jgi:hypothetical protein
MKQLGAVEHLPRFTFLPGEKVMQLVGMPGPDVDDCEVLEDAGGAVVKIRFQVYGVGPTHEEWVPHDRIMWQRGSETSVRYAQWKQEQGQ